jgi:signal transduction histidine kinase
MVGVGVVGRVVSSTLRAPFERRAWAELVYVLLAALLAAFGFAYVLAGFVLSAGLSVTALGIPLLAAMVLATRHLARVRRGLVRVLLGEVVPAPPPFRPGGGVFAWLRSGVRDGPGWRAVAFQVASLPLSIVALSVVLFSWAWGLVAFTAPVQHALDVNQSTVPAAGGGSRHGLLVLGVVFDTWPMVAALSAAGAALLLIAPWAVRGVLILDRLLVRSLLGRDDRSARIAALQSSRASAVEDAAATLRRIERDLHDGVQARLVALTMNLTMVAETLGRDADASRGMLVAARDNARDAIWDLREVVHSIHPPILDKGLDAAVATLAARSPVPVSCRVDIRRRPSAAIETIAYFCLAELLSNVAKHSGASEASIEVSQPEGGLRLVVTDNGRGGAGAPGGSGLRGLADRVGPVDGTVDVVSPPGGPTVITIDLPPRP